ncbi:hypothetical protein D5S17_16730 [Pseudonocardiaceae bacterium YIM PH 21723]|nr:hypothetical protein D5S17_16730 [Pseudonocardiaceae bacterium YIM PH 21723]
MDREQEQGMRTSFRVLGHLEAEIGGKPVVLGAGRQRTLLAALLLRANQPVGVQQLTTWLWDDRPINNPRAQLQTAVLRLRHALGDATLVSTVPGGYQMNLAGDQLDLLRFRSAVTLAASTEDLREQARLLRSGLAEWRGDALRDISSETLRREEGVRLTEEYLRALDRRIEIDLQLGRHADVSGELQTLVAEHPLRERFWAQLMLALYRSGRQAEALAKYRQISELLAEDLGVDPGEELRRRQQQILTSDPEVAAPEPVGASSMEPRAFHPGVPGELPPALLDFVGHDTLIRNVANTLTDDGSARRGSVVLSGAPGIGKSALAVHVAHLVRDRFPHGQLYANLRGFGIGSSLTPTRVLGRFVQSLGVPPRHVPTDIEDLTSLYRTLLAERSVLVVLDDATGPEQVRPLLPSGPRCAAIITSRNEMRGLAARQGARLLPLDVLSAEQALHLFENILGVDRVRAEPDAAHELARLCAYLPLALRIVAANLAVRPEYSLTRCVTDLTTPDRLEVLTVEGDDEAGVRATFDQSYAVLPPTAQDVFRLLSLVPGPDFTVEVAAALTGTDTGKAAVILNQLTAASLVHSHDASRFRLHDLLRLYANERCEQHDPDETRTAARDRLLDFYVQNTYSASVVLYPSDLRLPRPASELQVPQLEFPDHATARQWYTVESANLVAAIRDAGRYLLPAAWQIAEALRPYAILGKDTADILSAYEVGLSTALHHGNRHAAAFMHDGFAIVHWGRAEHHSAFQHWTQELAAHRDTGLRDGEARALISLGVVFEETGRLTDAADCSHQALAIAVESGHSYQQAHVLINLSYVYLQLGRVAEAGELCARALTLSRSGGFTHFEAVTLSLIGQVLLYQGSIQEATGYFTEARELTSNIGMYIKESETLHGLSCISIRLGDFDQALELAELAIATAQRASMPNYEVDALVTLTTACAAAGAEERALSVGQQALDRARQLDYRRGELDSLIGLSVAELARNPRQAIDCGEAALALSREGGYRIREGRAGTELAHALVTAGEPQRGADRATEALGIHRETGCRYDEARTLAILALALHGTGDTAEAHRNLDAAVAIFADLELPAPAEVRFAQQTFVSTEV